MPHKQQFSDINSISLVASIVAGLWGAMVSFIHRDKNGYSLTRKIYSFLTDVVIDVGVTLLVYLGLIGYGVNDLLSVAISGFMGHQGTRTFYLIELIIAEKLGAKKTYDMLKDNKNNG